MLDLDAQLFALIIVLMLLNVTALMVSSVEKNVLSVDNMKLEIEIMFVYLTAQIIKFSTQEQELVIAQPVS